MVHAICGSPWPILDMARWYTVELEISEACSNFFLCRYKSLVTARNFRVANIFSYLNLNSSVYPRVMYDVGHESTNELYGDE